MATETVTCQALTEFVRFVEGYGMVVGSPDSTDERAVSPKVPLSAVAAFVADGLVAEPKASRKASDAAHVASGKVADSAP